MIYNVFLREDKKLTSVMLKTALPTTPLTPMSSLVTKRPMVLVASSGALDPAAMKVAPATSGDNPNAKYQRGLSQTHG